MVGIDMVFDIAAGRPDGLVRLTAHIIRRGADDAVFALRFIPDDGEVNTPGFGHGDGG